MLKYSSAKSSKSYALLNALPAEVGFGPEPELCTEDSGKIIPVRCGGGDGWHGDFSLRACGGWGTELVMTPPLVSRPSGDRRCVSPAPSHPVQARGTYNRETQDTSKAGLLMSILGFIFVKNMEVTQKMLDAFLKEINVEQKSKNKVRALA